MRRGQAATGMSFPSVIRRWGLHILGVIFIGFAIYITLGKEGGIIRVMELKAEEEQLREEIARLKAEKAELESQIHRLEEDDPLVIEEEARRKGMIREGEKVYRLRYQEVPDSNSN